MRRILHIDMDAFFAAVEEKRRPEMIGRPVVIGGRGDPTKRGVVSTANYEARKFGIHSAMPLRTAHKLCPQAIFLPVDYGAYMAASKQFKEVLTGICPVMENVGIDECYLDASDLDISSEALADLIKRGIHERTGLTCSVGIAPNKLLAKIASDLKKPSGLTVLTDLDISEKIWPLPVRKLIGIGPKMESHLKGMGIMTIGQLAAVGPEALISRFGPAYGDYLFHSSRGIDDSPLVTHWEPKSMSRETTFQEDVRDWQIIARTLAALTRQVAADLCQGHYKARTFAVKIRFNDFETLTRAKSLPQALDQEDEIRRAVFACLKRIPLNKKVRLIGARAGNLEKQAGAPS